MSQKTVSFENNLNDLENIVNQLEQGDLTLDDALKQFEKGIKLTRNCQNILNQAQKKIETLITQDVCDESVPVR